MFPGDNVHEGSEVTQTRSAWFAAHAHRHCHLESLSSSPDTEGVRIEEGDWVTLRQSAVRPELGAEVSGSLHQSGEVAVFLRTKLPPDLKGFMPPGFISCSHRLDASQVTLQGVCPW